MRKAILIYAIRLVGLVLLVASVYTLVVLGIGNVPTTGQWTLLAFSALAAAATALAYQPVRRRLDLLTRRLLRADGASPAEVVRAFESRLVHAIPLDELLLQLAESLRKNLALEAAEVWTGVSGLFEPAASDPDAGRGSLILTPTEAAVLSRAGGVGRAWLEVWAPQFTAEREEAELRVAPITHAGELLGVLLAERAPGASFRVEH